MLVGVAPFAIIAALISGLPAIAPPPVAIGAVIALALFSTALSNILFLHVVDLAGPSLMAKANYFVAPVSVFFGIRFLDETFNWRMVIAFAIILTGMIIARQSDKSMGEKNMGEKRMGEKRMGKKIAQKNI